MKLRAGVAACTLALLTACSGSADPGQEAAAEPSATTEAETEPAETEPTPSPDTAGADGESAAPDAVPACTGLLLAEGDELAGGDVGSCLGAVMAAQGPARKDIEASDSRGTVEFTYAPSFAAFAEIEADETVRLFVDDNGGWLETPGGWIAANQGGDPQEQMAHTIVTLYRVAADVRTQVAMFSSIPVWHVIGTEDVTRPDGVTVSTWRIEAEAPFDYGPVVGDELVLWIDDERRIVQDRVTSSFGDITETTVGRFYDFGADIDLTPPIG